MDRKKHKEKLRQGLEKLKDSQIIFIEFSKEYLEVFPQNLMQMDVIIDTHTLLLESIEHFKELL